MQYKNNQEKNRKTILLEIFNEKFSTVFSIQADESAGINEVPIRTRLSYRASLSQLMGGQF